MVGLESGSQAMLDWMKKDAEGRSGAGHRREMPPPRHRRALSTSSSVFRTNRQRASRRRSRVAKALRDFGPNFQVALFYYRPYPGTPITDDARALGPSAATQPARMGVDRARQLAESVGRRREADADRAFSFLSADRLGEAVGVATADPGGGAVAVPPRPYAFPIEKAIAEWMRPSHAS